MFFLFVFFNCKCLLLSSETVLRLVSDCNADTFDNSSHFTFYINTRLLHSYVLFPPGIPFPLCLPLLPFLLLLSNCFFFPPCHPHHPALFPLPPLPPQLQLPWPIWLIKNTRSGSLSRTQILHVTHIHADTRHTHTNARITISPYAHPKMHSMNNTDPTSRQPLRHASIHCTNTS